MNAVCKVCGAKYEVEPEFFFGAAYISYGFNVALLFPIGFYIYNFIEKPTIWDIIKIAIPIPLLFLPFMYRFSRILWIYWMAGFKYNPKFEKSQ